MNTHITAILLLLLNSGFALFSAVPGEVVIWGTTSQGESWFAKSLEIAGKPITNAIAVSAGRNHALILKTGGSVVAWGYNQYGQTNLPAELADVVQVEAGNFFSLALDKTGRVSAWGNTRITSRDLEDIISISVGCRALALKRDRRVFSWSGHGGFVSGLTNIVAIASGGCDDELNLALRNDGTLVAWGRGEVPAGLSNVTAIAVGEYHSLALKSDGTVYGWGDNHCEQATGIKNPEGQRNASGLVMHSGQVLSNVVAIAAGNQYGMFGLVSHHSLALKKDGTVVGWGRICGQPVSVPEGLSNVVAISAGQTFCMAITTNAAVAERFRH
jgi:alpha-tubulin suppressor-like RCC1 family protein